MTEDRYIKIKRSVTFICRSKDDERLVTGVVADPLNVDSYGNMIDEDAIRRSALLFMEKFGNTGVGHQTDSYGQPILFNDRLKIVESWRARAETVVDEESGTTVPKGSWVLSFRVLDDDIWDDTKNESLTGFSFEALVSRKPIAQKSLSK
jgi:hypothetical protein